MSVYFLFTFCHYDSIIYICIQNVCGFDSVAVSFIISLMLILFLKLKFCSTPIPLASHEPQYICIIDLSIIVSRVLAAAVYLLDILQLKRRHHVYLLLTYCNRSINNCLTEPIGEYSWKNTFKTLLLGHTVQYVKVLQERGYYLASAVLTLGSVIPWVSSLSHEAAWGLLPHVQYIFQLTACRSHLCNSGWDSLLFGAT